MKVMNEAIESKLMMIVLSCSGLSFENRPFLFI